MHERESKRHKHIARVIILFMIYVKMLSAYISCHTKHRWESQAEQWRDERYNCHVHGPTLHADTLYKGLSQKIYNAKGIMHTQARPWARNETLTE